MVTAFSDTYTCNPWILTAMVMQSLGFKEGFVCLKNSSPSVSLTKTNIGSILLEQPEIIVVIVPLLRLGISTLFAQGV